MVAESWISAQAFLVFETLVNDGVSSGELALWEGGRYGVFELLPFVWDKLDIGKQNWFATCD